MNLECIALLMLVMYEFNDAVITPKREKRWSYFYPAEFSCTEKCQRRGKPYGRLLGARCTCLCPMTDMTICTSESDNENGPSCQKICLRQGYFGGDCVYGGICYCNSNLKSHCDYMKTTTTTTEPTTIAAGQLFETTADLSTIEISMDTTTSEIFTDLTATEDSTDSTNTEYSTTPISETSILENSEESTTTTMCLEIESIEQTTVFDVDTSGGSTTSEIDTTSEIETQTSTYGHNSLVCGDFVETSPSDYSNTNDITTNPTIFENVANKIPAPVYIPLVHIDRSPSNGVDFDTEDSDNVENDYDYFEGLDKADLRDSVVGSTFLSFCPRCGLCCECCLCLPPPPPPVRYIREQVQVPCPYPAYSRDLCCYPSPPIHDPCCYPAPDGSYYPPSFYSWPSPKRIYQPGQSVMPGYRGHIPGFKFHSAGRTFGSATMDTRCIMSQWPECCPILPCRIWEQ